MTPPRLSAAMIVRDEEAFLDGCLSSLEGVADEVVVVDTGSSDATREIAVAHGARLSDRRWDGDFAAARNAALDRATGDWILYIDADERVVAGDRDRLDPLLADPGVTALTVRFRPATGFTRYREIRLFRRLPELRFRGVIHESHLPALRETMAARGTTVGDSELAIDHLGYDEERPDKHRRNLPLLEARLAAEPDNVYCWSHLGHTLDALGREEEAAAAWRSGIEVVRGKPVRSAIDALPYLGLLGWLERRGRRDPALADEADRTFPSLPELGWRRARRTMDAGRWEEALPILRGLVDDDPSGRTEALMAHDQRLFSVWVHDALALCHFRLGRFEESAEHHRLAERAEPSLERTTKRRLAESLARRARDQSGRST